MGEVVFVVGSATASYGSALLRAVQLEAIVRDELSRHGLTSSLCSGVPATRNAKVVVSKSFALDFGISGMQQLLERGNRVMFDPVDLIVDGATLEMVGLSHSVIASSLEQQKFFLRQNGKTDRTFFVPHHVDIRLPPTRCQDREFRLAYFGKPDNARIPYGGRVTARRIADTLTTGSDQARKFASLCDVISATDYSDTSWMTALKHYNCHYALRDYQPFDGFKPFTKGYVAASCGAVVMALRSDAEAVGHLGEDYPYLFEVGRARDIVAAISRVAESFGSREWRLAEERMRAMERTYCRDNVRARMVSAILSI
ncbi:MAG: hypothetical protein P4M09_20065 [Devosia sp.]|nr:hypothetical protein [Devosia sp.]